MPSRRACGIFGGGVGHGRAKALEAPLPFCNTVIMPDIPSVPMRRPLVLVGMTGAGKTDIGRRLAQRLHVPFVDTSTEILVRSGRTERQILDEQGMQALRQVEMRIALALLSPAAGVIAVGGGAWLSPEVRLRAAAVGTVIWLDVADMGLLLARSTEPGKPLARHPDAAGVLQERLTERRPLYQQAAVHVRLADEPLDTCVDTILAALAHAPSTSAGTGPIDLRRASIVS
jgi:shikimate kinase